jgi:beta-glucanase (GH16 family)
VIDTSNYTVLLNDDFTSDDSLNRTDWPGYNGSSAGLTFSSAGATLASNASNNFGNVSFHQGETDSNAVYDAANGDYNEYGLTYGNTYGLYQATASVASANPGPGLLLWPANNVWPGAEIDLLEINSTHSAYATVHWMDPSTGNDQYKSYFLNIDPTKSNTYAIDWEPGGLTYYVNGQKIFSLTDHIPLVPLSFGAQINSENQDANSITISDMSISKINSLTSVSSEISAGSSSSLLDTTYSGEKNDSEATIVGSGSDNVVLQMSEQAYNGDAQFTVSVDGKQIGGVQTVTASHWDLNSQTFEFQGDFGLGKHTVSVDFLNDAYDGTNHDRNLYVDSVSYDGNPSSGHPSLYYGGSESIAVASATTYNPGSSGGTYTTIGDDTVIGGSGAVTVNANGPETDVAGGTGTLTFVGDTGADTVSAGAGTASITGNDDTLTFIAGTGSASIVTGTGNEVYDFINGQAGGAVKIFDFRFGSDSINLQGYSGTGIKSELVVDGSTEITLSDNTKITLDGVTDPTSHTIFS